MEMPGDFGPRLAAQALVAKDDAVDGQLVGDLAAPRAARESVVIARDPQQPRRCRLPRQSPGHRRRDARRGVPVVETIAKRSEERRGGKERVSTCRTRRSTYY